MTCHELRQYFEDPLSDAEFRAETEHLARCAECAHFIATQRQLRSGLRRLREAVPQFPGRLDTTVLADYRRDVMNRATVPNPCTSRRRMAILCVTGAVVAMVLVAVVVSSLKPGAASLISGAQRPESAANSQSIPRKPTVSFKGSAKVRSSYPARGRRRMLPMATSQISSSPDFRSLMYCDELSCGGLMDVIRVQLPSSGSRLGLPSTEAHSTVVADVLVGSDGIARGIRIVE